MPGAIETLVDTYISRRESAGETFIQAYRRLGEAPFGAFNLGDPVRVLVGVQVAMMTQVAPVLRTRASAYQAGWVSPGSPEISSKTMSDASVAVV